MTPLEQLKSDVKVLKEFFKNQKEFKLENVYIAGGCLRDVLKNKSYNDIDVYYNSNDPYKWNNGRIFPKNWKTTNSKFAKSALIPGISKKVQFISILHGKPENVVNQFDFTINAVYMKLSDEKIIHLYPNDSDLKVLDDCLNPMTYYSRLTKFVDMGYEISFQELTKMNKLIAKTLEKESPWTTFDKSTLIGYQKKDFKASDEIKHKLGIS